MAYAQSRKLFTIRTTLKKMLRRRGYAVPEQLTEETLEGFEAAYTNTEHPLNLTFMCTRERVTRGTDKMGDKLLVFFYDDPARPNMGIGPIREYIAIMNKAECHTAIIVVQEGVTSPAATMLRELDVKGHAITAFSEVELLVDIYEHERVPRHILLTDVEKDNLLHQLSVTLALLPKMQKQDPMARYLGLRVGDVVKIERFSMTVGHDVYYRAIVDSEDFT
jgi:DNA-directed RNA polymerase I, II, and III subunit RPABC1